MKSPAISKVEITSTIIDPRIIFQYVLKAHADGVILGHNNFSCYPNPSESDVAITKNLIQAGKVLNISVLDHIVLFADKTYFSLEDEGRI